MINEPIYEHVTRIYEQCFNKEIVIFSEEAKVFTGKTLKNEIDRIITNLIKLNIKRGDKIAIWSTNNSYWMLLSLAAGSIGAVVVPLNPNLSEDEISYYLNEIDLKLILCMANYHNGEHIRILDKWIKDNSNKLRDSNVIVVDDITFEHKHSFISWNEFNKFDIDTDLINSFVSKTEINDTFLIQFTSGTTSSPKGAIITQYSALNVAKAYGDKGKVKEKDVILQVLPYFHCIGSIMGLLPIILFPAQNIIMNKFDAYKSLKLINDLQCTMILGVPTIYVLMMKDENFKHLNMNSLRLIGIGGANCPPELFDKISTLFPKATVISGYGLTETSSIILAPSLADSYEVRKNYVGEPIMDEIQIKLIDPESKEDIHSPNLEGEIVVKGFCLTSGYYNDEENNKKTFNEEGWLHTGDLGTRSEEGYYHIIGRIDDMIKKGGEKISPQKIETAMSSIIKNKNVCVIGVKDKKYGEEIVAFIEGDFENAHAYFEKHKKVIKNDLSKKIMNFYIPKYLVLVPEFPRTGNGKIKKRVLKKWFECEGVSRISW